MLGLAKAICGSKGKTDFNWIENVVGQLGNDFEEVPVLVFHSARTLEYDHSENKLKPLISRIKMIF